MSWPDDNEPRYIVDEQPYVAVLDRAYAYRVVREWGVSSGTRRYALTQAPQLAAELNAADQDEDA